MTTRALVVGCDWYPNLPGASPLGAIDDAMAFRHWLLTEGGVQAADLRLLISETDDAPSAPLAGPVAGPADRPSFAREVESLVTTSCGDRLYLYFAGHGCRTDPEHPYFSQDALVFADFDPAAPAAATVAVRELVTQLAQSDFREIVVILDAARGFPFAAPIALQGFGPGWIGNRRSGAAVQFLLQAAPMPGGSLTGTLLDGLAGKAASGTSDQPGSRAIVRWSSLVEYLRSALPMYPPLASGQDPSLVIATPAAPRFDPDRAADPQPTNSLPTNSRPTELRAVQVEPAEPEGWLGEFEVRSSDSTAMLTIESSSGDRLAVGVGSIEGRLPTGTYVAVLVDPGGVDPRVSFDLAGGRRSIVVLDPNERVDGFRVTDEPALRWSSASAQLAAATSSTWSNGHHSFVVFGWNGALATGTSSAQDNPPWYGPSDHSPSDHSPSDQWGGPKPRDWADCVDPRPAAGGELTHTDGGWWIAIPMARPWCTIRAGDHRITVPVAPDSVSAIAVTSTEMTIALFDTTHAAPEQIAAQDRVQQYLGLGRLGAADLTSRLTVEADRRWPWGATAAVRRLIDRARRARDEGDDPPHADEAQRAAAAGLPAPGIDLTGDPPHQFVAQVPAGQRHRLIGRGPWAVWLDWP